MCLCVHTAVCVCVFIMPVTMSSEIIFFDLDNCQSNDDGDGYALCFD